MLFLKELEANLTVSKLMELCFEHPNFKDYCSVIRTKKGEVLESLSPTGTKVYFVLSGIYGMIVEKDAELEEENCKESIIRFCKKEIILDCIISFMMNGARTFRCKA